MRAIEVAALCALRWVMLKVGTLFCQIAYQFVMAAEGINAVIVELEQQ